MNKEQLVTLAAKSNELRGFCNKLCEGNDIHKDTFQEFLMYLWQLEDSFLIQKYNDIQFIGYCYYVLRRLNDHRHRDSKSVNSRNPLAEKRNESITEGLLNIADDSYDYEIDYRFDKAMDYLETDKSIKKYQAALLFSSVDMTTKSISEKIGTKQRVVIYQIDKLKQKIRANVK